VGLDAGSGAAIGRSLSTPSQEGGGRAAALTQRLWSMLTWSNGDGDPVSELIRSHRLVHSGADAATLRRAYSIAENAHRGQMRKSGEPYITHPLAVALLLAELGMDTITLVAALLHDTVEDTDYTLEALDSDFGPEIAHLVDGVTKFEKSVYGKDAEAETIRKMIIAAGRDVRVLVIKLADRLHNMRTLEARSPSSRARIAGFTREVLVPLADRLGIQFLKRDLEDAVLYHLEPEAFGRIHDHVQHRPHWAEYLDEVVAQAKVALRRDKVDAAVEPRPRHYYSIWKDTVAGDYPTPFDLPRIVVVVDGPESDCYTALGAIHQLWRPTAGRFKDFIASPKNNLYRSLHTTVIGPTDRSVEVLIRTKDMHEAAEYGVAATFRASHTNATAARAEELAWLRRVLDMEQDTPKSDEFMDTLRSDLAETLIQVIAQGHQVVLPAGATPVDVAYELNSETGDRCVAAKVNGRYAPLSAPLAEGDVVEIFTDNSRRELDDQRPRGPRKEWLTFVKSSHAQLQISRWFADHNEPTITIANKVRLGRAAIGLALRRHNRGLANDQPLRQLAADLGYPDLEALLVSVADRKVAADLLVERLIAQVDQRPPR
jgi:guanosine-3',5'-bis(diphosphate) 3'-pyrophosphohydrolase